MELKEKSISVLKLKKLFVKEFDFHRSEHIDEDKNPSISFSKKIEKDSQNDTRIYLTASVHSENQYLIKLTIVGIFNVGETDLPKNTLLERNAIAIIFPYLRSQLTLLTSQPSFTPLILPAININALFDENDD